MDKSNHSNVKLSEEFFHISFTPTNWLTDPWKCVEATERWTRPDSATLEAFDAEEFKTSYSQKADVLSDVRDSFTGSVVDDIIMLMEHERLLKGPKGNPTALRQGVETTPITVALIEMYKSGSYKDVDLDSFFIRAEKALLKRAEHAAFEYTVLLTIMRRLDLVMTAFPDAIRGTVHPKPDQYSPIMRDANTVISPWHGTAIVRLDGSIVTEYEATVFQEPERYKAWFVKGDEAPFYYEEVELP
ncbi:hypothetical protein [Corynebacterium cystitidis]|uniref:Uncharacterized protein n=1 Tax=Corynebacterium cystitidis DSM 20524 TaxID=1121357 RepID=A0A1H9UHH2_9CORY|nr:hypothetical protein [Corynebacterium cystitidis]WJY83740.1 hypothetical protein CCYS_14305 [Corynebacterium cystitidis DSM 20524]SES08799.1 hypothetical protein SAMN05661109_01795 [Corynebacterium cystitidis DSM 20524]SNV91033.1 Uncharacterised protein [Corynebacterium cystitidis]